MAASKVDSKLDILFDEYCSSPQNSEKIKSIKSKLVQIAGKKIEDFKTQAKKIKSSESVGLVNFDECDLKLEQMQEYKEQECDLKFEQMQEYIVQWVQDVLHEAIEKKPISFSKWVMDNFWISFGNLLYQRYLCNQISENEKNQLRKWLILKIQIECYSKYKNFPKDWIEDIVSEKIDFYSEDGMIRQKIDLTRENASFLGYCVSIVKNDLFHKWKQSKKQLELKDTTKADTQLASCNPSFDEQCCIQFGHALSKCVTVLKRKPFRQYSKKELDSFRLIREDDADSEYIIETSYKKDTFEPIKCFFPCFFTTDLVQLYSPALFKDYWGVLSDLWKDMKISYQKIYQSAIDEPFLVDFSRLDAPTQNTMFDAFYKGFDAGEVNGETKWNAKKKKQFITRLEVNFGAVKRYFTEGETKRSSYATFTDYKSKYVEFLKAFQNEFEKKSIMYVFVQGFIEKYQRKRRKEGE